MKFKSWAMCGGAKTNVLQLCVGLVRRLCSSFVFAKRWHELSCWFIWCSLKLWTVAIAWRTTVQHWRSCGICCFVSPARNHTKGTKFLIYLKTSQRHYECIQNAVGGKAIGQAESWCTIKKWCWEYIRQAAVLPMPMLYAYSILSSPQWTICLESLCQNFYSFLSPCRNRSRNLIPT